MYNALEIGTWMHQIMEANMPHVAQAIIEHRLINNTPGKWAKLEYIRMHDVPVVRLFIGIIHTDGTKETYQTIKTFYVENGKVMSYTGVRV